MSKPISVGFDISAVVYGRGVSRYTEDVVKALAARHDIELSLFGSSRAHHRDLQKFASSLQHKQEAILNWPQSLVSLAWRHGFMKVGSSLQNIDVFHSWDWMQPPDKDLPLVSTIHDLAMLRFPETAHPKILSMHQRSWKILRERQARIIAVSQATKADILEFLDIPSERIHVIHEALPTQFHRAHLSLTDEHAEHIRISLQLEKPFILTVGTREPRKNLEATIEAWKPLAAEVDLVIAGDVGWDSTDTQRVPKGVRLLGKVSDEELVTLYQEAEMLAYMSLYEGFGLPILEAFSVGTPVVTSNCSSMPEVAGNAAVYVDPLNIESMTEGMRSLLHESLDDQRTRLQRMLLRLHLFDWSRVAQSMVKVYFEMRMSS